jgi:hypothetical protein
MAFKDLLVYGDQSARAVGILRLAADLARRHESQLTALDMNERSPAQLHEENVAELSRGPSESLAWTTKHIQQAINESANHLRHLIVLFR